VRFSIIAASFIDRGKALNTNIAAKAEKQISLSIVIPAYNEERALPDVLKKLEPYAKENGWDVLIVNDGSTDATAQVVSAFDFCTLINHPYNKGYGAAVKTAVRNVKTEYFLLFDSDGQHNPEDIPGFLADAEQYDMIIGARRRDSALQLHRMPGKKILTLTANYLTGMKIPDLNSGFRLARTKAFKDFMHIYPNGFSISTTSTIAFLQGGYSVRWEPIRTFERVGRKSNVNMVKDGFNAIMLILRVVTLFNPLKVFLPGSFFVFLLGLLWAIYGFVSFSRIPNTSVVIMVFGFLLFFAGILADLISSIRRGPDN